MKVTAVIALCSCSSAAAFAPAAQLLVKPQVVTSNAMTMKLGGGGGGNPFRSMRSTGNFLRNVIIGRPSGLNGGGNNGNMGDDNNGGNNNNNNNKGSAEEGDNSLNLVDFAAMGVLGDLWDKYNDVLASDPILTKACTSLCGFSIGDTLAQKFVSKGSKFDYQRLARMAAFGFLFHGTISHFFYGALDEALPGVAMTTVAQKVFIDQVLWAPIFTFVYLTWIGLTSGQTPEQIIQKVKSDLIKGVVGSWTVWPLAHTINFRFIPSEQRLLYINSIQIGYNIFLSVLGSGGVKNAGSPVKGSPAVKVNIKK